MQLKCTFTVKVTLSAGKAGQAINLHDKGKTISLQKAAKQPRVNSCTKVYVVIMYHKSATAEISNHRIKTKGENKYSYT